MIGVVLENPDPKLFQSVTVIDQWFPMGTEPPTYVAQRREYLEWDGERRTLTFLRRTRHHEDGLSEWFPA